MARLLSLAIALSLGGCLFNDCSFDTETLESTGTLQAQAGLIGDTLTVAFVDTLYPSLDVYVRAGLDANPVPSGDGTVRLGFNAESFVFQNSAPTRFDAVVLGDTVYVYVVGALGSEVFTQVCSPPEERVRLDVALISAPAPVRAIRTVRVDPNTLRSQTARVLRQRDAHRPTSV